MQQPGRRIALILALLFVGVANVVDAQSRITSPKAFFGHNIGDDYWLANYDQFTAYWRKLDAESDRMQVLEIGKTAEGRSQLMAIVTAPANFAKLDRYKEIARRLAHAEGIDSTTARALAKEGKAVVWIDGGLHATEVLGAHQLMETSYQFVSRTDDETTRILNDVIILFVHANPDGMQLVSNWYMSEPDTLRRNTQIPRLYQKYIGHDNNRDFYMSAQPETQNMNHVLYWEWFPQIMYNHHQTGPAGSVMFAPPFRDPHNHNFDRLIVSGLDLVGAAMHHRFIAENKPGVVMRRGAGYSTWWNGGLRTTVYFHNMIGLLTETIGNPTPMRIPLIPGRQEPTADVIMPIEPQEWHFRQSIDYSVTANYAVLDMASRYRETFLYNIWRMGMNSIERGRKDTWTVTGPEVDMLRAAADSARRVAQAGGQAAAGGGGGGGFGGGQAASPELFTRILRDPADRDPRAYVLSAAQADFPTATKFINTLRHVGVTVERATRDFMIGGKTYPAGSYVVPMAQAFRPHVLDMFEPQEHPNDFAYPGAPPTRPYDNAGYTLAYQMGVDFDRILDAYTCPCERITGLAAAPPATVANARGATGFILTPKQNDAFIAVSRVLKANGSVSRLTAPFTSGGRTYPIGSFYVAASGSASPIVQQAARQLGIRAEGVTSRPSSIAAVRMPRIALWDTYGGSMPSGWTRWILEQYEIPFTVIYTPEVNAGNLRAKYDALVLTDGAIQGAGGFGGGGGGQQQRQPPEQFRHMVGRITQESAPHIQRFIESGGEVLTIGSSTRLASMLNLPVKNALVERTASGEERPLPGEKFYIPGSLLRVAVDTTASIAWGSPPAVDVMFDESPAFRLDADANAKGLRTVAWFDSPAPLRSGWAWGQAYLNGAAAIVEARMGQGSLYLFGPEILFRSQPHGTFRFFFNALLDPARSPAQPVP
jgi:hypothetical protein